MSDQKLLYKIAAIFSTPVDENEGISDVLTRMDKQGRFDFSKMQKIIALLCEELAQKE